MAKATILTVDDDENIQMVLQNYLEDDGYAVIAATTGAALERELEKSDVDVILLDLVLPDAEGLGLISKIRMKTKTPIIIVSGKSDTTEKIIGLEMGADDYITKPFELRELSARIKAVLRRHAEGAAPATAAPAPAKPATETKMGDVITFNDWTLDRAQYQLFNAAGESADLTAGEFRVMEALVMSPNRVLTRDYLFELTRDSEFEAFDRAVDIQIGRIRKKMTAGATAKENGGDLIKTVRGVGYMFAGQIRAA